MNFAIAEVHLKLLDETTDHFTTVCTINTSNWKEYCFESFLKYTLVKEHAQTLRDINDTQRLHVLCLVPATGPGVAEITEIEKQVPHTWVVIPTVRTWVVEAISGLQIILNT